MKTFNQDLKDEIVSEIIRHRKADQITQGAYGAGEGRNWRGCAVGCAIHSLNLKKGKNLSVSNHSVYETEFGIPIILAKLEDRIFEGLSVKDSKTWPENFMSAVPVNADLSLVWPKFAVWLLTDGVDGVIKYAKNKEAIQKVSDLYSKVSSGQVVERQKWRPVHKNAAAAAAAAASYAAAAAYAAYAAAAAADYTAAAAAAAADTAAAAAASYDAYTAARLEHYKKMANKLIEILEESR